MTETDERIRWKKDFVLTWDHFKGIYKSQFKGDFYTGFKISHDSGSEILETSSRTKFKFTDVNVMAVFLPKLSWVNREWLEHQDKEQLIDYVRGQFDLTEDYARKVQTKMENEVMNRSFTCPKDSKSAQIVFVKKKMTEIFTKILNGVDSEYFAALRKYTQETNNGKNLEKQKEYNKFFVNLRKEVS